jgi:DNA repair protein RadC
MLFTRAKGGRAMDGKEYLRELLSFIGKESDPDNSDDSRSLMYVFESTDKVLSGALGYSDKSIELIRLTTALNSRRITDKLKIGKKYLQNELIDYLTGVFFGSYNEKIIIICIAENGKLLRSECVGEGTVNTSTVIPRQIVEIATECGAAEVIMAHNHPGGVTTPSDVDKVFTSGIRIALNGVGIKLTHHYIVAGFEVLDCMDETIKYDEAFGFTPDVLD